MVASVHWLAAAVMSASVCSALSLAEASLSGSWPLWVDIDPTAFPMTFSSDRRAGDLEEAQ